MPWRVTRTCGGRRAVRALAVDREGAAAPRATHDAHVPEARSRRVRPEEHGLHHVRLTDHGFNEPLGPRSRRDPGVAFVKGKTAITPSSEAMPCTGPRPGIRSRDEHETEDERRRTIRQSCSVAVDVLTEIEIARPATRSPPTPPTSTPRRSGTRTSRPSSGGPSRRCGSARGSRSSPLPRPPARVHVRDPRARARRAARDEHRAGAVPDGDDLHVVRSRRTAPRA